MKKITVFLLLLVPVIVSIGCYGDNVGKDGAMLRKYMEPSALKELVDNPRDDIWIIDVRPASSYNEGHIPTSKNFPSSEIMNRLDELPKTKYLILA